MMRFKLPVVAWLAAAMLAGCGGGDSPSVNTQDAQERRRALAVAGDLVVAVAPTVVGLQMESERRISRTVYEYTFVVQARNDSPFNRSGVVLGATSSLAATDIVLGDLQFPSLPAGATANASNRLVLRHDRAVPFDASKIRWTDRTPVITGKVMDGYIRGATIYWDCNANRRFDLNEVSTISGPGGAYTIDPVPASGCHLYAQVGPNAVDEDHPGQTVGSAYQLAAAPAGYQLITPYTTLVHGMLNQEPGLSVALADDRLQKSIGFNCGSLLYDYIGSPNAVIACDTAIKTAAKFYREVLQEQPASMPYDIVVERALERMQQLAANPGHAASLGLGLTPYIYVDSDYGALLRAWAAEHQPNPSIRAFTVRAGSSRATEQALRGFADFVGNKGSVASGFIDLHAVNDTDLQALMHQLRRAAEADPSLASQAEIAAARTRRSEMLAAAGALFIGGVDDETELVNLFTNDPQATWDLAKTLVLASASMALDGLEIVHFRPGTVIRPSRHTTIANARKALEKRKAMVERLQGESAYESAIRAWINYTNDPQQQTEEKLDEATALTIAAAIDVAKRLKDNPSQPSSLLALMSFANAAEMDRESQLRVFKDTLALAKDLIEVALPGNPIAAKVVATLDVAIQYFEVRFAAEDLVASAGNVQKERLDAATAAFRTEASRVMRDYFRAYIAAYQANLVLVDTSSHDFVDRVSATPLGDGAVTVTSEGAFRMNYLPTLGGQVCTTMSASPKVMTFRCPASAGAALFELKTADGATLPGAASWVEGGSQGPTTALFDDFPGSAIDATKWNIDGWEGTGNDYTGGLGRGIGPVTINNGLVEFGRLGRISTKNKVTFSGDNTIVIEGRTASTGALHDTSVMLVDTTSGDQILMGETNYAGWGFYAIGIGSYKLKEPGSDPTNPLHLGGITTAFMEYRLTITGDRIKIERGPTLANITQTGSGTLGRSIVGRTFHVSIGAAWAYYPATWDWIRVKTGSPAPVLNPANGRRYEVIECGTWTSCRSAARAKGGELATVRNKAENDWLVANVMWQARTEWGLWIGLTDELQEGVWRWSSGEPVTFTGWRVGEPNNFWVDGRPEQYVHMWRGSSAPTYLPGVWNDIVDQPIPAIGSASLITQAIVEYLN